MMFSAGRIQPGSIAMKVCTIFVTGAGLLFSCAVGPGFKYQPRMPEFKPVNGMARVVMIRAGSKPTGAVSDGNDPAAEVYVDTRYTSETYPNTVVSFHVDPGEHFVFSRTKGDGVRPLGSVKFNFRAGKIYYLEQKVADVPFRDGSVRGIVLVAVSAEKAHALLSENKELRYGEFRPGTQPDDLDQREFATQEREYSKREAERPDEAKKEAEYPGY
jgi:hypothetical protein